MIKTIRAFALHWPSLSVGLTFMSLSLLFGSWLGRLPQIQHQLMLSEGQLGLALLGLPLGALSIMPFANWLTNRLSGGQAVIYSSLLLYALFPLPAFAQGSYSLFAGLYAIGLANGYMNISMNAAAAAVEREYQMTIMSICHGMFSLGAMLGAGSSSLFVAAGIPIEQHLILIALLLVGMQLALWPVVSSLPKHQSEGSSFALPPKALLGLAFIGFCIMIGEGAIADWGAIFLHKETGASASLASLGYAGFSMTMAIGRFAGDSIRLRLGADKPIAVGSLLGAAGIGIALLSSSPLLGVIGFTLVGLGFSTVVPLLFSAAANTEGVPAATGIAAIASAGTIGFLIAPPLIGMISEALGLQFGLGFVALLALSAAAVSYSR
jgi:predicted MFS family arabinose efflux permease